MSENFKLQIVTEQDKISNYQDEVSALLKTLFNIDNALVTDITELSDFTYSGLSEAQYEHMNTLEWAEKTKYWDKIILDKFKQEYGLELKTVCVSILDVLEMIEAFKNKTIH